MKRVTIEVDLENNEILEESIRLAIEGEVKRLAREGFDKIFKEELSRLIDNRFADYTDNKRTKFNFVRMSFMQQIDSYIRNQIPGFKIAEEDMIRRANEIISEVRKEANAKLEGIRSGYESCVSRREEELDAVVAKNVERVVREIMGNELLRRIFGQEGEAEHAHDL